MFLLFYLKFNAKNRIKHILYAFLFFSLGLLTRPSFLFIPITLLLGCVLFNRSRKLLFTNIALLVFTIIVFGVNNYYLQKSKEEVNIVNIDTGRSVVINQSLILTEIILETKQFHKGTIDSYKIANNKYALYNKGKGVDYLYFRMQKSEDEYNSMYPDGNLLHYFFTYFKEKPQIVLLNKLIFSPIFFFALSSREIVSYILLITTVIYTILTILGFKLNKKDAFKDKRLILYFLILLGYFLLHWATHSYSRYSLAVIPFLFIWAGIPIERVLKSICDSKK
jgi:hypothetical protein